MISVNDAFRVKYKVGKDEFQVLVDFDKLKEFRAKPDEVSVYDVLADVKIFKDQRRGEVASANALKEIFKSDDEGVILKEILLKGECQIPTAYLNKMRDVKKVQVVNYIVENALNPSNKMKYTPTMIEGEIDKVRYNFDPDTGFEKQAEDVIKLLKKTMPISIDFVVLEIEVPAQYCGAFYGPFRKFGRVMKEYYDNSGNLRIHIEMTQSRLDDAIVFIKLKTNGEGAYHVK